LKNITADIVSPAAEAYAEAHTTQESEVLHEINHWSHLNLPQPHMIAGAYQGQLLRQLSLLIRPRVAVEVGSYVGYSTICLAEGLAAKNENDDAASVGILHAIEVDEEREDQIRRHLTMAGLDEQVCLHIGDALQVIPTLPHPIDLAYIDADKRNSQAYYDLLVPMLRPNGVLLIDNTLWGGKVLCSQASHTVTPAEQPLTDLDTRLMQQLNDHIQADERVDNILLPLRDGLMLCRKR
jgi:predicted O-methyltransferase YrrM